jgi:predicted DNA-binding protein
MLDRKELTTMPKPIQIYLDEEFKKKLQKKLIDEGKTISDKVRELLEKYVDEPSKK